ncbi:hypothetical protein [Latilactobacillus curvatus]|uniref:hypothetical protein n=1 Tax=Latilactobacillus curvatus TaxID=28038 RepID=UPI0020A5954A|nr:hypothetical protein [Latilactobacillus curvatus]UTC11867.1 hypothetical protein A4W75_01765 [Latilactobacillus curvatus]
MVRETDLRAQDPRVQRTKQQLRQALIILLKDSTPKGFRFKQSPSKRQLLAGPFISIMKIKWISSEPRWPIWWPIFISK